MPHKRLNCPINASRMPQRMEMVTMHELNQTPAGAFKSSPNTRIKRLKGGPMRGLRVHHPVHSHLHGLTHRIGRDKGIFKDSFGENTFTYPVENYMGEGRQWRSMRLSYQKNGKGKENRKLNIGHQFIAVADRYRLVRGVCDREGAFGKLPHLSHFLEGFYGA